MYEAGPLIIVGGRHPLTEKHSRRKFVANDVYLGPGTQLQIVTGPNCSGKSTYLRQVAVLVILAHIGCFLPAQHASVPLFDCVCTRVRCVPVSAVCA